jgi:hypothetical protein
VHLRLLPNLEQQIELLRKELVIVLEIEPKERVRLDERATTDDDFRPPTRDEIDSGELLKDPHGIIGAEHRHRARQPNARRARRGGRQQDRRRRRDELGPVMLADPKHIEPDLIRELDLRQEIANPIGPGHRVPGGRVQGDRDETVNADLHRYLRLP